MTKHPLWNDEYWLLLMQLYLKKPLGVKPLYSRPMVKLSLELHIPPQFLYERMFELRRLDTPKIERLWSKYANSPSKLSRGVKLLRQRQGFNSAGAFYEGVDVNESFERDFKPLLLADDGTDDTGGGKVTILPVMLILVLDLYFRLVPATMVASTPEVAELARLMKLKPQTVVDIMEIYQLCDPYLNRQEFIIHPLLEPCQQIWQRFGNGNPEKLAALAAQLKDYFL